MNDIRRTILWVIFGFSMVLLWDQWQVYNGHKATFFPHASQQNAVVPDDVPKPVPSAGAIPTGVAAQQAAAAVPVAEAQKPASAPAG